MLYCCVLQSVFVYHSISSSNSPILTSSSLHILLKSLSHKPGNWQQILIVLSFDNKSDPASMVTCTSLHFMLSINFKKMCSPFICTQQHSNQSNFLFNYTFLLNPVATAFQIVSFYKCQKRFKCLAYIVSIELWVLVLSVWEQKNKLKKLEQQLKCYSFCHLTLLSFILFCVQASAIHIEKKLTLYDFRGCWLISAALNKKEHIIQILAYFLIIII